MKKLPILTWLSSLVAILALAASGAGLFSGGGGAPVAFTTMHGQEIHLYGRGLYQYDWDFKAPIFRGSDAVVLFLFVPLLIFAILLDQRGLLRGRLLLASLLSIFLYYAASLAFGAAYNNLFLVYILLFSASLFAFILAFASIDPGTLAAQVSAQVPRRGIAIFLLFAGLSVFVWLIEIIGGLTMGKAPSSLASYTTDITAVLDLGIISPAVYLTSVLLFQRAPLGYLLASILLVLNAGIGVVVVVQTAAQALEGIALSVGQAVIYVGVFVVTSLFATGFTYRIFRGITEPGLAYPSPAKFPSAQDGKHA